MLTSINIKRITQRAVSAKRLLKQLFYIHRELTLALMLAICAGVELVCSLLVEQPWQYLAYTFALALALIAALLVRNVIAFERRYPSN